MKVLIAALAVLAVIAALDYISSATGSCSATA